VDGQPVAGWEKAALLQAIKSSAVAGHVTLLLTFDPIGFAQYDGGVVLREVSRDAFASGDEDTRSAVQAKYLGSAVAAGVWCRLAFRLHTAAGGMHGVFVLRRMLSQTLPNCSQEV